MEVYKGTCRQRPQFLVPFMDLALDHVNALLGRLDALIDIAPALLPLLALSHRKRDCGGG